MDRNIASAELPDDAQDVTEDMLCAWLGSASPGDRLAYHRGFLAIDTRPEIGATTTRLKSLQRLARRALRLWEKDLVHLVQRREADNDFTYFAVARHRTLACGGAWAIVLQEVTADEVVRKDFDVDLIRRRA